MSERIEKAKRWAKLHKRLGLSYYTLMGTLPRWVALASKMRRDCERTAVNIAMWYPQEDGADAAWVRGLVSRAYEVAQGDNRTPHDILMELIDRVTESGFKLPFGTPEEMILG